MWPSIQTAGLEGGLDIDGHHFSLSCCIPRGHCARSKNCFARNWSNSCLCLIYITNVYGWNVGNNKHAFSIICGWWLIQHFYHYTDNMSIGWIDAIYLGSTGNIWYDSPGQCNLFRVLYGMVTWKPITVSNGVFCRPCLYQCTKPACLVSSWYINNSINIFLLVVDMQSFIVQFSPYYVFFW